MMMMPLMLMKEQTWSHPISMEMREYSGLSTLLKLLRELIEGLVGKQKRSIHQPCGAVVLMAKMECVSLSVIFNNTKNSIVTCLL